MCLLGQFGILPTPATRHRQRLKKWMRLRREIVFLILAYPIVRVNSRSFRHLPEHSVWVGPCVSPVVCRVMGWCVGFSADPRHLCRLPYPQCDVDASVPMTHGRHISGQRRGKPHMMQVSERLGQTLCLVGVTSTSPTQPLASRQIHVQTGIGTTFFM